MDLIYTNGNGIEQGVLPVYELDLAFGIDENDFEIILPYGETLEKKSFVYIDGTEWGGIIRGSIESTMGEPTSRTTGTTWHGILGESFICPDAGTDFVTVDGEANAIMRWIVSRQKLSDVFSVSSDDSGIGVSYRFARFADAYAGIRKMLASANAKLRIEKPPGGKPTLSAVPVAEYIDERSSNRYAYEISDDTPYNHIICLGKGDLAERDVVHLYADAHGNVSATQTMFGLDERQFLYELSNEEHEKLVEDGTKKLIGLQQMQTVEMQLPDGETFDVGDIVGIVNDDTGTSVTADVTKVIVKVSSGGSASVTNKIGEPKVKKSAQQQTASGAGMVVYKGSENITVNGNTIAAKSIPLSFIESL